MLPTFSPCCGSPQITDTGSTIEAIVDERGGNVLGSEAMPVYRCGECEGSFAAIIEATQPLADADFVYARAA